MPKQSTLAGWFSVKKRGRDDEEIEEDRQKALDARSEARKRKQAHTTQVKKAASKPKVKAPLRTYQQLSGSDQDSEDDFVVNDDDDDEEEESTPGSFARRRKPSKATATKKSHFKGRKKLNYSESEDESDAGSMDDFVVDDDEEEEELEVDSSSEEELEIVDGPRQSRMELQKSVRASPSSDDSDSDEGGGTFLQSFKHRPSKPSHFLQRASIAAKTRTNPGLTARSLVAPKVVRKTVDLTASRRTIGDDSEVLTSPSPPKRPKKGYTFSDSDSDRLEDSKPAKSKYFSKTNPKGKNARKAPSITEILESSSEDEEPVRSHYTAMDSLIDSPEPTFNTVQKMKKMKKKQKSPKKRRKYEYSDDSDDNALAEAIRRSLDDEKSSNKTKLQIKNRSQGYNDSDGHIITNEESTDEDERIALQQALKESKIEATKAMKSRKSAHSSDEDPADEQLLDAILEESSEEEDQGEDYEEEKKAATSVLHTAEQLSAQVLRTMTSWIGEKDSSGAAPKGMIVNGALSLGSLHRTDAASDGDASCHKWISQEIMREACSGVKLSNYQLIGVNWLALLHGMKCNIEGKRNTNVNGVLADEMGLGKTVQTIAFLAWLKHRSKFSAIDVDSDGGASEIEEAPSTHLIVVPVSVLPNWMREFETFCPEMNVVKYHGSQAEREEIQNDLRQYLPQNRSRDIHLDVILAPVTYFQKEKSDDRKFLNKFRYDYLVVDEAHMLKNAQSTRYRMLDRFKTKHRLLLTGTPVQNSPQELLNMLYFLMPLFSRGRDSLEEGSENGGDRMLQHFVDEKMEQNGNEETAYKKLKHLFAPFVLRRKKADVISQLLPPKERVVEFVELDSTARCIYESILASHVNKNGTKITAAIGDHLFTNLRKAAHHPLLLRTRHNSPREIEHLTTHFHKYGAFKGEGSTKARVAEEITKFNDFHIHLTALELIEENKHRRPDLERYILDEDALFSSAKFERLRTLLPKLISEGHRILIFSVWTSCLDLLGCLLEHLDLKYMRMDGSCTANERQELIDQFNSDSSFSIFLLSTKACGIGINLTAADTCIIHDLDFNPFNDLQAEDRCHRIGQTKKVTVYKMVTSGTVDADIFEMQERKSKMNAAIMESKAEKKERKEMLQTAVERFLGSPKGKTVSHEPNKENKDVICLI